MSEDPRQRGIRRGAFLTSTHHEGVAEARTGKRGRIAKGQFMTVDCCPVDSKRADDALCRSYPEFADTIEAAGPRPSPWRLAELAEERAALEQRMEALRAKIAALRNRK